ncbi:MAG: N-acetylmuramoyl-L-alanine amidase [Microgenomates group bacterium Gr01-1014_7]|nr:MAG: N-acetylmuramoyl-L-alanine amidase [Microgenomates group bacterium Gr01-1014_7]
MKKLFFIFLTIFTFFTFLITSSFVFAQTPVTGKRIVLDAGHSGTDSGSTECLGLPEKDANLDIAFRLKALLEADGAIVGMTRNDDSTLSNNGRYTFANNFGGEALVSIHLNGSVDHSKNGTKGLYGQPKKDKTFTEVVHASLAKKLGVSDLGTTNFASGVLLKSKMAATIQEAIFISNTQECVLLTDGTGNRQQQIAQALHDGIVNYFASR